MIPWPSATLDPAAPPVMRYGALVIAGPTAVGKTAIALAVAEHCGGEIIGADAFQVYAGLDLLSAKPTPTELARVPHHLIGEIPLTQAFDVAQYTLLATARMREIRARGRVPIIVGGTGLYLRALQRGLADLPAADHALRAELESQPFHTLQERLRSLDPIGAETLDLQNPRRVIRALEVCLLTGQPFSSFRIKWAAREPATPVGVRLQRTREELCARIDRRVEAMFAAGVLEEVAASPEPGPTARQMLGWRDLRACAEGRLDRAECLARLQAATRQYAKRQATWLKREEALVPIPLVGEPSPEATADTILRQGNREE